MSKNLSTYVLVLFAAFLTACAGIKSKGESHTKPTVINPLDNQAVNFTKKWKKSTDAMLGDYAHLISPVVESDILFSATEKGAVIALAVSDASVIWKYKSSEPISAGVSIDVYHVYFVTADSKLHALNKKDGSLVWSVDLQSTVVAAPVSNNLVLVVHGVDGKVSGFDPHTGNNYWVHQEVVPSITIKGNSRPMFVGSQWVFQGLDNGRLIGLRTQQGGLVFERTINISDVKNGSQTTDIDLPIITMGGGIVVVSQTNSLLMVSMKTGEIVWEGRYDEAIKSISSNQDKIVVVTESDKVFLHEGYTGKLLWSKDELKHRSLNKPAVTDSHIYLVDYKGLLHMLNINNGKFDARLSLGLDETTNPVIVVGSDIIAVDNRGKFVAYHASLIVESKSSPANKK